MIAERRSVTGLPEVLNAAEFASLQDARRQARLGADDGDHLIGGGVRVRQCSADADHHVREAGQIDRALGYLGRQLLQECQRGSALFGRGRHAATDWLPER